MNRDQEPNWQPVSSIRMIAEMIDGQLEAGRDQYRTLVEAEVRPYRLDDATVARVQRVYGDTKADLWLYDTQLSRWRQDPLTSSQQAEVGRLEGQMIDLNQVVEQILALAVRLKGQTIETLLAKSDFEIGLEWLPGHHDRD